MRLWDVDVEALFDYVERLGDVYFRLGRREEFSSVLERLRENIRTKRWRDKIVHLNAIMALGEDWDEEAAYREITKLGPIASVSDKRILPFYLNLAGDKLGLAERISQIDRVLQTTEDDSTRIHQLVVKAILLHSHYDADGSLKVLEEAIKTGLEFEKPNTYERLKLAQAYSLMGSIYHDAGSIGLDASKFKEASKVNLERAAELFSNLLKDENWNHTGIADLYHQLAGVYRLLGRWELVLENEQAALRRNELPIYKVFEAEVFHELGENAKALSIIDGLSLADFADDWEKADFILHFSRLAVSSGDLARLEQAKDLLDVKLKREPIFRQQALEMMKIVLEAINVGQSASLDQKAKKASSRSLLSLLNSVLILKPNIFGVGIDVNKVIEGAAEHSATSDE
ncbi:MAG TPA: tetratricopeptide repeat protein [Henriciella marina]|nr:tetratricopeptide repeat protein [Henriciella marina]